MGANSSLAADRVKGAPMPPTAWALASMWSEVFDAPRFRGKGCVQRSSLNREALAPLLKLAASCVAALLPHMPGRDRKSVVPPHGASRELLVAAMDGDPAGAVLSDPAGNPAGFVRGLVKSAFMTGDGELIEGLEEAKLEELINMHCSSQLDLASSLLKDPTADMQTALDECRRAVEQLISRPAKTGDLAAANQRLILTQRLAQLAEDAKAIVEANSAYSTDESKGEADDVETESGMDTSTAEENGQEVEKFDADQAPDRSMDAEDMPPLKRTKSQIATTLKVQKVKKHTDDLSEPVNELARSVSKLAKQEVSPTTPIDALRAEMAAVEQARKRAVNFGEDLLEDMVQLDSLSGLTEEDRESRKATISGIEALLQDVDAAKGKLAGIHRKLEAQLKTLEAEETKKRLAEKQQVKEVVLPAGTPGNEDAQPQTPSTQPTPRNRSEQAAAAAKAVLEPPPPGKDVWTKVRLPLRFHSQEEHDHYSLAATCPGLDLEDLTLELSEDGSTLTVAGLRVPSKQEAESMRGRIAQKIRAIAQKAPQRMDHLVKVLPQVVSDGYIELGQGAFGRFAEKFRIPDNVDVDSIDASYRDGILRVVLPKHSPLPTRTYPGVGRYTRGRGGYPQDSRSLLPGLGPAPAAPWGGSLFGGHDDFFRW